MDIPCRRVRAVAWKALEQPNHANIRRENLNLWSQTAGPEVAT